MSDIKGLLPCSKCGVFPILFHDTTSQIRTKIKLRCPHCGTTVMERNVEDAVITWNYYYGKHTSKCISIVEFRDHHYERVDQLYNNSETGKIWFTVNGDVYLYYPDYLEDEPPSKCCGVRKYMQHVNNIFLKYDESVGKFYITDDIIQLLTSKTDEGIKELEHILQTEEKREGGNEMKNILELVDKIEELLKKSKFEWFMCYNPKEKSWNFHFKEK